MATARKLTLYVDMMSQPCRAIVMAAPKVGAQLALKNTIIHRGETQAPAFLELNPAGQVPVLVEETPGQPPFVLSSSTTILRYLCDTHTGDLPLYPKPFGKDGLLDKKAMQTRALIDSRLDWYHAAMRQGGKQWVFAQALAPRLKRRMPAAELERSKEHYQGSMQVLSKFVGKDGFIAGRHLTIADIFAACEISQLELLPPTEWNYDMLKEKYPDVHRWFMAVRQDMGAAWEPAHAVVKKAAAAFHAAPPPPPLK